MQELCLRPKLGMHIINDSTLYSAKYGIQYMVNILTSKKQKFHAIKNQSFGICTSIQCVQSTYKVS